jgi:hypothetical protein
LVEAFSDVRADDDDDVAPTELASIPGIGPAAAREIVSFLRGGRKLIDQIQRSSKEKGQWKKSSRSATSVHSKRRLRS